MVFSPTLLHLYYQSVEKTIHGIFNIAIQDTITRKGESR